MTITASIEHDSKTYTATVAKNSTVEIDIDGVWAGKGRWAADRKVVEDCDASLPDEAYDALDAALAEAQCS